MRNMKRATVATKPILLPLGAMALGVMALGGCGAGGLNQMLGVPTPEPTPKMLVKPTKPVFVATDYITKGTERPGLYRVTGVLSGELVTIQGVPAAPAAPPATVTPAAGAPAAGAPAPTPALPTALGVPETVHLGGLIAPAPGQPGWQSAVQTILNWTANNPMNQTVRVEDDPRYPRDPQGRMMVQIYFKGTSEKTAATEYNLNRMMVRSGYAVVDLYNATAIDIQQWLNDEQYARNSRLGLWGLGITLAQRIPPALPVGARVQGAGKSNITVQGGVPGGASGSRKTAVRAPRGSAPVVRATPATAPRMTAPTPVANAPGATPAGATPAGATPAGATPAGASGAGAPTPSLPPAR